MRLIGVADSSTRFGGSPIVDYQGPGLRHLAQAQFLLTDYGTYATSGLRGNDRGDMASSFGWLDGDDGQRSAMLEVVKLFEDSSTVDELGIGSVRDTFSNTLFPGTSTLHTRAKYFLFVAWLVNDVARHRWAAERSTSELRRREARLIAALLAGGESQGVIGRDAKSTLKRMPSELYWASLEHWGVRRWRTSIAGYFRNSVQHATRVDEQDADDAGPAQLGMASLPPMPDDLLSCTTFELDRAEAEFLKIRVAEAARETLLAWLMIHQPDSSADWIWDHESRSEWPIEMSTVVDDARRVHFTATGPAILYNVMMAELTGSDEIRDEYASYLDDWAESLHAQRVFKGWDRAQFWSRLLKLNPRIRPATKTFLEDWWALCETGRHDTKEARNLIQLRELQLKRARARLTHPEARTTWSVGAGTGLLDFRWTIARRHLNDVAAGLGR